MPNMAASITSLGERLFMTDQKKEKLEGEEPELNSGHVLEWKEISRELMRVELSREPF